MTALKPIENRRVHGVQLGPAQYALNTKCAHPDCNEPTADPHHCFPRSAIGNAYWYVEIGDEDVVIPHVSGLCRAHHDDVEEHRAWIKYEDGVFVWYDRNDPDFKTEPKDEVDGACHVWEKLGPLNPQPGSRDGKPKRQRFRGEAKRVRKTISTRVPDDAAEDGAGILDDLNEQLEEALGYDPPRPRYNTMVDAYNFALMWVRDNPREVDE